MGMYIPGKCLLLSCLKRAGLSQQDLADLLNMPRQQVSDYANNRKRMSLTTAYNVSRVLRCPMEDLYEWIPQR